MLTWRRLQTSFGFASGSSSSTARFCRAKRFSCRPACSRRRRVICQDHATREPVDYRSAAAARQCYRRSVAAAVAGWLRSLLPASSLIAMRFGDCAVRGSNGRPNGSRFWRLLRSRDQHVVDLQRRLAQYCRHSHRRTVTSSNSTASVECTTSYRRHTEFIVMYEPGRDQAWLAQALNGIDILNLSSRT